MAQLQDLSKKHADDPITKENIELLAKAKKDFKLKNKEAVEEKWLQGMSAEEKAERDPRRYLREVFPAEEIAPGVIVIKVGYPPEIQTLAEELGLEAEIVEAPLNSRDFWSIRERSWVVVGQQRPAVVEKVRSSNEDSWTANPQPAWTKGAAICLQVSMH